MVYSMRTQHVVVVDETGTKSATELAQLAAALQVQADRDLGPAWGVRATVTVAGSVAQAPTSWPVRITRDVPPGAGGVHLDHNGQPFAVVLPDGEWTVAASHELLEMLVDPRGSRLATAPSLDPGADGRLVHYLVEVGDPVETQTYSIDGVLVSDFVLRDYYHRVAQPGDEYDQLARVSRPFQVLKGGYISWLDPADGHWHQVRPDGSIVVAGKAADLNTDFRSSRDRSFADDKDRHNIASILAAAY